MRNIWKVANNDFPYRLGNLVCKVIELDRIEYQPIIDVKELVKKSILITQSFQNKSEDRITVMAFSGGKDSLVSYMMCVESGIKFKAVYSPTSVDPPELIYYIRQIFNPWAKAKGYPKIIFEKYNTWKSGPNKGKIKTMWSLISNRAIPPTRLARYCCDELKERTGEKGDTIITGVRWEESRARSKQSMINFYKGKNMVRNIVFWKEAEVWSYILENNIPYCELYDMGFNRIGCIGCPLSSNMRKELNAYPKYRDNYIRAFNNMIQYRKNKNMNIDVMGNTGEKIYKWWIGDCDKKRIEIDGQCSMF